MLDDYGGLNDEQTAIYLPQLQLIVILCWTEVEGPSSSRVNHLQLGISCVSVAAAVKSNNVLINGQSVTGTIGHI